MLITGKRTPITNVEIPFPVTVEEAETIDLIDDEGAPIAEVWRDEFTGDLGIACVNDGQRMIAYFDTRGFLIGDWIV